MNPEVELLAAFVEHVGETSGPDDPAMYPQRMLACMRLERVAGDLMDKASPSDRARIFDIYSAAIAKVMRGGQPNSN